MVKKLQWSRQSTLIAGLAGLALLMTGCASAGAPSPGESEKASGEITVWVGSWWESQVPLIQEAFAKDHPEISVNFELLSIDGYLTKFTAATLGGTPPDVIDLEASLVSTAAAAGLLENLDDYVGDLDGSDFAPAIWGASHYQGSMYAYPDRSESEVYYYNKTVFDRAGVEYPTADWTYEDLREIAKKITIPGTQTGMGISADSSFPPQALSAFAPMLWSFGGDFLDSNGTKATIDSPEGIEAITYWSEFYTKDHSAPSGTPNFTTTRDLLPLFQADQLGIMVDASNTYLTLQKDPDLQWGAIPAPDGGVNRGGGWAMGVPVGAKNPAAARVFLDWFVQPANLGTLMNRMPSVLAAQEMPPWNAPEYDIFKEVTPASRSLPSVASGAQIQAVIITELQKVLTGQSTPEEGAKSMAEQLDAIIAENAKS